ncbi:hypothetical protein GOP47_0005548 [Adiantum capillus-veneris]|uniref:Uncharacterized protein n=1 Tax=Adiantum capillus-veneris TaxID=13818 RepID=A0A9D4V5B9_ADICA|nr:hypothetical protein GOP47_0005548 [Adiantum capillus-veneris]
MEEGRSDRAREALELAYRMANLLNTGLDRPTHRTSICCGVLFFCFRCSFLTCFHVDVIGIRCYSSKDLRTWRNEVCMWMHMDAANYSKSSVGLAHCPTPVGSFTYLYSG